MLLKRAVELLRANDVGLTLMDVGASGDMHAPFKKILPISTLVQFDPDTREMKYEDRGNRSKIIVINKAVTSDRQQEESLFYLTENPFCSSTLRPDSEKLAQWCYAHEFRVTKTVMVPTTTIPEVLARTGLAHIDWLKVDSQGTDTRIIKSLPDEVRRKLMVCDAEPGFYEHYENADLFGELHEFMVRDGFWLAHMHLQSQPRISADHYTGLLDRVRSPTTKLLLRKTLKRSPTAPEVRYIRTIPSAIELGYDRDQFLLLWAISVFGGSLEHAYDVASEMARQFTFDEQAEKLAAETAAAMTKRALLSAPALAFRFARSRLSRLLS